MKKNILNDFTKSIESLVNLSCWGFVAGVGTGSIVSLQIGEKILRSSPMDNPNLTSQQQQNDGEYVIYIECVWRLETKTKVICGTWDDNSKNGLMLKGLQQIVDQKINFISLSEPGLDLKIGFDNGLILQVFCDSTDKTDNYSLHLNLKNIVYVVSYHSKLKKE